MAYSDVEALWLARLQESGAFNSNNSARARWSILNTGKANHYAILRMGRQEHLRYGMGGRREHVRQTVLEIWKRPTEESASAIELQEFVDELRVFLDGYPTLGDTTGRVRDAMIVQTGEMLERRTVKDGPVWYVVELTGECHETETV